MSRWGGPSGGGGGGSAGGASAPSAGNDLTTTPMGVLSSISKRMDALESSLPNNTISSVFDGHQHSQTVLGLSAQGTTPGVSDTTLGRASEVNATGGLTATVTGPRLNISGSGLATSGHTHAYLNYEIISGTANINFDNTTDGATNLKTFTATGLTAGSFLVVHLDASLGVAGSVFYWSWPKSGSTVSVYYTNASGVDKDPATVTVHWWALKPL